jgi:hypothetical protein
MPVATKSTRSRTRVGRPLYIRVNLPSYECDFNYPAQWLPLTVLPLGGNRLAITSSQILRIIYRALADWIWYLTEEPIRQANLPIRVPM